MHPSKVAGLRLKGPTTNSAKSSIPSTSRVTPTYKLSLSLKKKTVTTEAATRVIGVAIRISMPSCSTPWRSRELCPRPALRG